MLIETELFLSVQKKFAVQYVRVDHGSPNFVVAQQFLHCANVVTVGQQERSERMANRVARNPLRQSSTANRP
jgi:hypothetical protein